MFYTLQTALLALVQMLRPPSIGHTRQKLPLADDELKTIAGNIAPYLR
jgi:hypothetical protein